MPEALEKILFVDDDNELVSELAIMAMEAEGFEVFYCESGCKALTMAAAFEPQLILLDVLMPDMDGIETFKMLRTMPELTSTPIVFLTGLTEEENQQKFHDMGALGLIPKPFDPSSLCKDITSLWDMHDG